MDEASLAGTRGEYHRTWPRNITFASKWKAVSSRSTKTTTASSSCLDCLPQHRAFQRRDVAGGDVAGTLLGHVAASAGEADFAADVVV